MAETLADDTAVALLGNTIATGAILVVLITVLGPVSGAHFNPAVTLAFAVRRELPPARAVTYMAVQISGGVAGTVAAHLMFEQPLLQFSETARAGPAQWFAEMVATFGLVATILAGLRFRPSAVPWLVGLYISAAYWFTASTSFANPAVTIARCLSDTFSGIRPVDVPAFLLAQAVGALFAATGREVAAQGTSGRDAGPAGLSRHCGARVTGTGFAPPARSALCCAATRTPSA